MIDEKLITMLRTHTHLGRIGHGEVREVLDFLEKFFKFQFPAAPAPVAPAPTPVAPAPVASAPVAPAPAPAAPVAPAPVAPAPATK